MFQLFKNPPVYRNTKFDSAQFTDLRTQMNSEIARIKAYYRNGNFIVNNTHLLNQLLLHLNVSLQRDNESYVQNCMYETERLARVFHLYHPVVSDAEPRNGTFYNKQINEYIILHETDFDYTVGYLKWERLTPIKVHSHPFTDLNGKLLNGSYLNANNERGNAVISINLPMLALQYKAWLEHGVKSDSSNDVLSFLLRYPILNTLTRHMEICLINRTINTLMNKPVCKFTRVHPIAVVNFDERVDRVIAHRKELLEKSDFKFDELFHIFQCLISDSWFKVLKPIDIPPVRNIKWVLELSIINYIVFWVWLRNYRNASYNQAEVNTVLFDLKRLDASKSIHSTAQLYMTNQTQLVRKLTGAL